MDLAQCSVMGKIAGPSPFLVRVYRATRIGIHLLEGVATTTLLFPLLRPRTQRMLVRLWSSRLLRMLNVDMRLHGVLYTADGHVQPIALRYRTPSGRMSVLPAYFGNITLLGSLWRITGARSLIVDVHARPILAARDAHRRDLAGSAECAIREVLLETVVAREP